ncbi:MAG: ribosomal protein S18-alanine N-acetyltransferase [Gemmatimonadota bacterium]
MIRSPVEGMVVDHAAPNDAAHLAELERATFSDPWSEASFRDLVARAEAVCFVARAGETLAGYVVAYAAGGEAELANIAVAPGSRRAGVASRLLSRVIVWARERHAADMWLEVRASNNAARELYGRFGFFEVGVRKRYYDRPVEDAIIMRSELSSGSMGRD